MIRAFVGIPVPEPVARSLTIAQAGLEVGYPVPPENFHITLAFLGEQQEPVVEEVADALSLVSADAFDLRLSGLGTFGSAPRILFADVAPSPALSALRKRVRRIAVDAGIEMTHERFRPHVTLARFGRGLVGDDAESLRGHIARRMAMVDHEFQAQEFTLYESHLGRSGPSYAALATFSLRVIGDTGSIISS